MPVTLLDGIVLAVVIVSAILAMVRGFVREVLSIASWVAAAAAAYFFYKPLVPFLQPYITKDIVATIVAAAIIFFIALIVASYLTMKIADFVIDSRVGFVDRVLGLAFGAVRGLLIVAVAFLFFQWLVQPQPEWVANAETKPLLESVGNRLRTVLPKDIEDQITNRLRGVGSGKTDAPPAGDGAAAPPPADGRGNTSAQRNELDRLIRNSNGARN